MAFPKGENPSHFSWRLDAPISAAQVSISFATACGMLDAGPCSKALLKTIYSNSWTDRGIFKIAHQVDQLQGKHLIFNFAKTIIVRHSHNSNDATKKTNSNNLMSFFASNRS